VANMAVLASGCGFPTATGRSRRAPTIGYLSPAVPFAPRLAVAAFRRALRAVGYVEGESIEVDWRFAASATDQGRMNDFATQLVRRGVDLILTTSNTATQAALESTNSIPIVMAGVSAPVESGFVRSLSHPGGNVTGLTASVPGQSGKQLELLHEAAPRASRIAVLFDPSVPVSERNWLEVQSAAAQLGVWVDPIEVHDDADFGLGRVETVLDGLAPEAVLPLAESTLIDFGAHRSSLIGYTQKKRVPSMYCWRKWPDEGGLMAYAPDDADLYSRSVTFIDKVLKGRAPADLPVEQPSTFQFVVNLGTAKWIALTLPPTVATQVTEWVR
jgi:ABC-type uncharacterized transport system substrate-binding protein